MAKKIKINFAAVITQSGNSIKNKTGSWRIFKPKILKDKCDSCGICVQYCPEGCIKIKNKKTQIDYDFCKGCGICAKECLARAIIMEKQH